MTKQEARRYMIRRQQELKDGGVPIDSDRIQALRVAIEALDRLIYLESQIGGDTE